MLYSKLRKDPHHLFECIVAKKAVLILLYIASVSYLGYGKNALLFSFLSIFLISPNPWLQFAMQAMSLLAIIYFYKTSLLAIIGLSVLGAYWGGVMSIVIHNASHEINKSPILNRILGEISGFFLTVGFINFLYVHIEHHVHSDTQKDPNRNANQLGFMQYWTSVGGNVTKIFQEYLPGKVCRSQAQYKYIAATTILNKVIIIHLQLLWFGEEYFSLLCVPCIIGSQALFAFVNFETHPNTSHARDEIVDINESTTHKMINTLFSGVLFHKSHHTQHRVANPMKHRLEKEGRSSSVSPSIGRISSTFGK